MLTFSQLLSYYSPRETMLPKHILVEYLQYELLDSIFKLPGSEFLSFMGGTAIRIVHHSGRFSEDLDFDNFGLSFQDFEGLTTEIMSDMKLKGFVVEFRVVEKGAYHCYIKFPHLLQQHGLTQHAKEKILVRLDMVRKEKHFSPVVHSLNRFDIYRDILTNPIDIVLSQKLIAILERKRAKGRDFYDVSFLFGLTTPNITYIEQAMEMEMQKFQQRLLEKCATLNFDALAKDVAPFLVHPEQIKRVQSFPEMIAQHVT